MSAKASVVVAGAIIENDRGEIFCARRSPAMSQAGKWEFPGGKVEAGENPFQAVEREFDEEFGCQLAAGTSIFLDSIYDYETITVRLLTIRCALVSGDPRPAEHDAISWQPRSRLSELDWAPADLPTVRALTVGPVAPPPIGIVSSPITRLILVTGSPGAGKTSAVKLALERLAADGVRLRATLSEATSRLPDGRALGFNLALYRSAAAPARLALAVRRELAHRARSSRARSNRARSRGAASVGTVLDDTAHKAALPAFVFRQPAFDLAAFFMATGKIRAGVRSDPQANDSPVLDLAALDEIGPFELGRGAGFMPVLTAWRNGAAPPVIVLTVRPNLTAGLAAYFHDKGLSDSTTRVIDLDALGMMAAASAIIKAATDIKDAATPNTSASAPRP